MTAPALACSLRSSVVTGFGVRADIGFEAGVRLLGDAVEQPVALAGFVAVLGDGDGDFAIGGREVLVAERDRLHFQADLQLVLALPLVDIGGGGADAPEGLQAQFAIDDFVVLVLRLAGGGRRGGRRRRTHRCASTRRGLRTAARRACRAAAGCVLRRVRRSWRPRYLARFTPVRAIAAKDERAADVALTNYRRGRFSSQPRRARASARSFSAWPEWPFTQRQSTL